jgi:hypothetical protein
VAAFRVTAAPVQLGIGQATRVTLTATDACGNPIANYDPTGNIVFSTNSTDPAADKSLTYSNGTGVSGG